METDMNERISIAIDGPSGAGKSSVAKGCAKKLGLIYVDTGAIYRTVGLSAYRAGADSKDSDGVAALLPGLQIELRHDESGAQRMILNGQDVSEDIRLPIISIYASDVSAMPPVRAFLLEMQRDMARRHNVIMDGRDIGTVVLPDAKLKIFMTASPEKRAQRRLSELKAKGVSTTYEEVLRDIEYRDANDSSREAAPLKPAEDAVFLDNTPYDLEENINAVCEMIRERFNI
jgi:cytidylate kinase